MGYLSVRLSAEVVHGDSCTRLLSMLPPEARVGSIEDPRECRISIMVGVDEDDPCTVLHNGVGMVYRSLGEIISGLLKGIAYGLAKSLEASIAYIGTSVADEPLVETLTVLLTPQAYAGSMARRYLASVVRIERRGESIDVVVGDDRHPRGTWLRFTIPADPALVEKCTLNAKVWAELAATGAVATREDENVVRMVARIMERVAKGVHGAIQGINAAAFNALTFALAVLMALVEECIGRFSRG